MTSIIVFITVTIMAIFTGINVYKIINSCVTYKKYYPYRKLVIVRIPYTIIWSLLTTVGIYIDIKMQNKYQHHKDNNGH